MPKIKEIKNRIASVKDTQKITNAMYLIASTKLRKAKNGWNTTRPYFMALQAEIKRIFRVSDDTESKYFYPAIESEKPNGTFGYLVITADKGLAGAYNQSVIRETERLVREHPDYKLFVVGEYGRQYFLSHGYLEEEDFFYTAQNPSMSRARKIAGILLNEFDEKKLDKIFVVYTDMKTGLSANVKSERLLPFHRAQFYSDREESKKQASYEFVPSIQAVLDAIIPGYVAGYIYSALVDSFCAEQNARMTAMDSANRNAQKILDELSLEYNHVRQTAITQEITEVSAGAKAQKK